LKKRCVKKESNTVGHQPSKSNDKRKIPESRWIRDYDPVRGRKKQGAREKNPLSKEKIFTREKTNTKKPWGLANLRILLRGLKNGGGRKRIRGRKFCPWGKIANQAIIERSQLWGGRLQSPPKRTKNPTERREEEGSQGIPKKVAREKEMAEREGHHAEGRNHRVKTVLKKKNRAATHRRKKRARCREGFRPTFAPWEKKGGCSTERKKRGNPERGKNP